MSYSYRETQSATFQIYIAGDMAVLKEACRVECERKGWCVAVAPVDYIYTGGEESGAVITIINYAKFPESIDTIESRVVDFATLLLQKLHQKSCSIVGPEKTFYIKRDIPSAR